MVKDHSLLRIEVGLVAEHGLVINRFLNGARIGHIIRHEGLFPMLDTANRELHLRLLKTVKCHLMLAIESISESLRQRCPRLFIFSKILLD